MTYPTQPTNAIPTVATDANYSDPGQAWDAQPTKVLPPAAIQTQGFKPATLLSGDYLNYLHSVASEWLTWAKEGLVDLQTRISSDEWIYPAPKSRVIIFPAVAFGAQGWTTDTTDRMMLRATVNNQVMTCDLGEILPDGATLTSVRALVTPGSANAVTMKVFRRTLDFTTPGTGTITDISTPTSSGTSLQVLASGAFSEAASKATGKILAVEMVASSTAGTNNDKFWGLEVSFTDPGPRNT